MFKRIIHTIVACLSIGLLSGQELTDITSAAGLTYYSSLQRYGTGASIFDINGDGWLDIHVSTAHGERDHIYLNLAGQGFEEISQEIGLDLVGGSIASLWLDYDGDQLVDLLLMNSCEGIDPCDGKNLQLFKQGIDGTFTEVTALAGLDIFTSAHLQARKGGLAAGDLNLDGSLDIILTHWGNGEIFVLLNKGDGTFKECGEALGITGSNENFFQPLIWDVDYDGDLDLYVNVDSDLNRLYLNEHFSFSENAFTFGLHANNNEMGIAIGDINNDQLFDLYMTNIDYEGLFNIQTNTYNVLYQAVEESGKIVYTNIAHAAGVKRSGWGWGTTFLDIDNDGLQDLAATNGVDNIDDPSKLWRNTNGSFFVDISDQAGFNDLLDGSALLQLDFDQDGDLDLLQTANTYENQDTSIRLLQNDCPECGHFILVRPRMIGTNHFGIGATVKVTAGSRTMMRLITAGISYCGQEGAEAHFGLGSSTQVDKIEVIWPGGASTIVENIAADQIIEITDAGLLHRPRFSVVTRSDNWVELEWNHISSQETGFEIQYADKPDFENAISHEVGATVRQYSFDSSLNTETLFFRVRAKDEQNVSAWSPLRWIGQYLEPPTELRLGNEDMVNPLLEWRDNSSTEAAFIIERSADSNFTTANSFSLIANTVRYQDFNLEPGNTYYYRVAAVNDDNLYSTFSNVLIHQVTEDEEEEDVELVYPNPASTTIHLPYEDEELTLFDMAGRQFSVYKIGEGIFDIKDLPQGVFFLYKEKNATEELIQFIKI